MQPHCEHRLSGINIFLNTPSALTMPFPTRANIFRRPASARNGSILFVRRIITGRRTWRKEFLRRLVFSFCLVDTPNLHPFRRRATTKRSNDPLPTQIRHEIFVICWCHDPTVNKCFLTKVLNSSSVTVVVAIKCRRTRTHARCLLHFRALPPGFCWPSKTSVVPFIPNNLIINVVKIAASSSSA